ncbi:hypothetical protein NC653_028567 [Populus alba x Populus x berolinensis]|uniref:Uncharacterized protein n=1 Tax=Populus alba x Populus x berolinensis TaxID=444605 RepID=A0AAD6M0E4_9ROSI|nr:hypothetical protein NC653_028567 [Populus alba x Populus x berolinensis]
MGWSLGLWVDEKFKFLCDNGDGGHEIKIAMRDLGGLGTVIGELGCFGEDRCFHQFWGCWGKLLDGQGRQPATSHRPPTSRQPPAAAASRLHTPSRQPPSHLKKCVLSPLSVSKPPPVVPPTNNWYQSPVRRKTEVFWGISEFSKLFKTSFDHTTV